MLVILGRWEPLIERQHKLPIIFYACCSSNSVVEMTKTMMERFGLKQIVVDTFPDLKAAEQYATQYFKLDQVDFSPFPIDHKHTLISAN